MNIEKTPSHLITGLSNLIIHELNSTEFEHDEVYNTIHVQNYQQDSYQGYTISIILKYGITHNLSIFEDTGDTGSQTKKVHFRQETRNLHKNNTNNIITFDSNDYSKIIESAITYLTTKD